MAIPAKIEASNVQSDDLVEAPVKPDNAFLMRFIAKDIPCDYLYRMKHKQAKPEGQHINWGGDVGNQSKHEAKIVF